MYLKTLTLKGFKSFAESATIRLEPGVTVVVGPNGSGKSNVVDAVAWVLGAQAPSAVRSARMDDVIFAGTDRKPPLGRAEVSLTIDNSDGMLASAASEVRITRTLFRDGESSYSLNGTPCRLLDVVELLSDTGVGRQQHMIVSQTQVDAVLSARPVDRRAVVEEAAGVLKYRKRRERAERRLLGTDGDLTRISDLTSEVRRRLRPLEKQAEAARRHADLLSELEALRVYLAGQEIAELRKRLRAHKDVGEARAAEKAQLQAELAEVGAGVAENEQRLARHGLDDHSERLARLE
ncbi:MAG: AAA family ATPase, partial [Acidimicrobiaceae bacterium]|nr:AAA family ATPase [Acidimicrobiaceae bacterium]